MTLKAVRQQLITYTGRYDLVVDTVNYADAGADAFIKQGQRWLDRQATMLESTARWYHPVAIGDWYALVPQCRSILSVWMSNDAAHPLSTPTQPYGVFADDWWDLLAGSVGQKWELRPLDLQTMRQRFRGVPSSMTPGVPRYYALPPTRTVPESLFTTTIDQWGATAITANAEYLALHTIIWMPPAASVMAVEVQGLFYQHELVGETDRNIWSEQYPHLLVLAAAREIEMSYRNQQGVMDYETQILKALERIEFDLVEQESAPITGMKG